MISCASYQQAGITVASLGKYCAPLVQPVRADSANLKRNVNSVFSSPLRKKFSKYALLIANAAGVLPQLNELVAIKSGNHPDEGKLFQKRLEIIGRIELMITEVSSLQSELNCEQDRCRQVTSYLSKIQEKKIRRSTIYSVLAGAATGILVAFMKDDYTIKATAIAGGALAATYGIRALSVNKKIRFDQEHNLLTHREPSVLLSTPFLINSIASSISICGFRKVTSISILGGIY